MRLINKSRGTGKTTQLIYTSAITGFRIITPNAAMAKHIEKQAKDMGIKILPPMSDVEYRNRKYDSDHTPVLIDELQNQIINEALELYFSTPVVAATMTVPIDDCCPPTPKPLVFDHKTEKVRPITNRDVFNELFGHVTFKVTKFVDPKGDMIIIQTEDGENMTFIEWLERGYVAPKEGYNDAMCDFRKKSKTDVLDKIRTAIEALPTAFTNSFEMQQDCLKIIDKYKEE